MPHTIDTLQYTGPERRSELHMTDEQMDAIAEKAANKAVEKLTDHAYRAVGKNVVEKFLWVVGLLVVGTYVVAQQKGWMK